MGLAELINSITQTVIAIAWGLFILTWTIGWVIRGSPIPFLRVKRVGQDLIEDAVWAAFWLAMGSTLFAFISYIAGVISSEITPYKP